MTKWFHASPHHISIGVDVVPGGGPSVFADAPSAGAGEHVWLSDTFRAAQEWAQTFSGLVGRPCFVYEVLPCGEPRPYDAEEPDQGYVVDRATMVNKVADIEHWAERG